jgi:hypothetical protein
MFMSYGFLGPLTLQISQDNLGDQFYLVLCQKREENKNAVMTDRLRCCKCLAVNQMHASGESGNEINKSAAPRSAWTCIQN